jgi:hypothetical protein
MANFDKLSVSEVPVKERQLRELLLKIRDVAAEIEFAGPGDTANLAWVLDRRRIRSLKKGYFDHPDTWLKVSRYGDRDPGKLIRFLKRYLPDLWQRKPTPGPEITEHPNLVSHPGLAKAEVSKIANREKGHVMEGWSIRQDRHGYFRAYKKIRGKVRSIYLGKTFEGAGEKLRTANESDR